MMKRYLFSVLLLSGIPLLALAGQELCTDGASVEARELYAYLSAESGKHTLSGQHGAPLTGGTRLVTAQLSTGSYPAVFSQDFGFSAPGTWDGINFRQAIVDEAIRRHQEGFIINLMWHAVRPVDDEPVEFKTSIQGKLTDAEWAELTTPGTALHERWKSQVDVIAFFLKQLRDARVPVLWRPYHEMNGDWFWWGYRPGPNGSAMLYRMLYDRLVHFHKLNNLIWVFGGNEVREKVGEYADFFPGHDEVDVLATDVYSTGFAAKDYNDLLALAKGKPIALAEVGNWPTAVKLKEQPAWSWFVLWDDAGNHKDRVEMQKTVRDPRVQTWEKLPWVTVRDPKVHSPVIR